MLRSRLVVSSVLAVLAVTALPADAATPGRQSTDTLFPTQGNSGYDVRNYAVDLTYTPLTNNVDAEITITAKARKQLSSFNLDFSGPEISSIVVDGGEASFKRSGKELQITPIAPVGRGSAFTTVVSYAGTPPTYTDADDSQEGWVRTADGAIALGEPVGAMTWLPSNNTPADKATFDYRITVPTGYQAVANGLPGTTSTGSGTTTYVWRATDPMSTYLAMIGIGRYDVTSATYRSIDGRTIPIRNYVDATSSAVANVARLPKILKAEEKWFGPYPFRAAGSVVDNAQVGYALETQTRPFYPTGGADTLTMVHETAHQWFGDSVTLKDWHDIWLAEGFATYAEWLWSASHGGESPQQQFDALYAKPASDGLWHPAPRRFTDSADLFGEPVYNRGAMTLQVLRNRVGTDDFFQILRTWARVKAHANATTTEFVKLAEKISGRRLDGLFTTWLDTDGKPKGY